MILELAGGDHADGQDLAVARLGAGIGAMPHGAQQVVKDDVDGYNQRVVHRSFLRRWVVSATPFSGMCADERLLAITVEPMFFRAIADAIFLKPEQYFVVGISQEGVGLLKLRFRTEFHWKRPILRSHAQCSSRFVVPHPR